MTTTQTAPLSGKRKELLLGMDDIVPSFPEENLRDDSDPSGIDDVFQTYFQHFANEPVPVSSPPKTTPVSAEITSEIKGLESVQAEYNKEEIAEIEMLLSEKRYPEIHDRLMANINKTVTMLYVLLTDTVRYALLKYRTNDEDYFINHAFEKLLTKAKENTGWSGSGSLEAWLIIVAKNALIGKARRKASTFSDQTSKESGAEGEGSIWEETVSGEDADYPWAKNNSIYREKLEDQVNINMVFDTFKDALSAEQRSVFQLLYDGHKPSEVAKLLSLPVNCLSIIRKEIQVIYRNHMEPK